MTRTVINDRTFNHMGSLWIAIDKSHCYARVNIRLPNGYILLDGAELSSPAFHFLKDKNTCRNSASPAMLTATIFIMVPKVLALTAYRMLTCGVFLQPALPFIKLGLAYFNAAASFANGGSLTQILGSLAIQLAMSGAFKGLDGLKNSIFGSIAKGISWVSNGIAGTIAKLGGPFVALSGFVGGAINSGIQSKIFGGSFSKAFKSSLSSQLRGTVFTAAIGAGYSLVRSPADNLSKYSTQNELAKDVYDVKQEEIHKNGFTAKKVWDHKLNKSLPSGTKAALYSNGTDKYVAFAGTGLTDGGDWLANIMQAFGFRTRQYDFAEILGNIYGDTVHYIGHSLGGGQAATAAIAGGGSATIFNASGLSPLNFNDNNDITHVVSNADLLQLVNSLTPVQVPGVTVPAGIAGIHDIEAMCGATSGNCSN